MRQTRTLWTRQRPEVWEELKKSGVYRVKKEYIEEKNGSISEYYLELYRWYTKAAEKYITIPPGCEYPIWLSVSEDFMLQPVENTVIFRLDIPEGQYLICNMEGWGYRVNYWYVPLDKADDEKHKKELARYGIAAEDELVTGRKGDFYPMLRRKITDSWERIFTVPPDAEDAAATAWELRKEWVQEVRRYDG
nr:DUF3841 domain-containing protein [uncultured Merdimonas sp.]